MSTEDDRIKFEKKLDSFIGKNMKWAIYQMGEPPKMFENFQDKTYAVYDHSTNKNCECKIRFVIAERITKNGKEVYNADQIIEDWDYKGNCCSYRNSFAFRLS